MFTEALANNALNNELPLVVDLDGTLIRSDALLETVFLLLKNQPHRIIDLLRWTLCGKAHLKARLAESTQIDVAALPYDTSVIALIQEQREMGRTVILATASHELIARKVADHLSLFDDTIGSKEGFNLSAKVKRDVLVARYGERGFDYVGNSRDDIPVWQSARHAIIANPVMGVERKARRHGNVVQTLYKPATPIRHWRKALRIHQWLKNLLLFVPLLASHAYSDLKLIRISLFAFVAFGLCASSVYVLNDLIDLPDDRHHHSKRDRSFAAGHLPLIQGVIAVPALLIAAFGIGATLLPRPFIFGLGSYVMLTMAYSLGLKRIAVIDVIVLALLYSLRIIVGATTLAIPLSYWLLGFSMFMFLSLALVKRCTELLHLRELGTQMAARGRGYYANDLPMVASLGAAAGYIAVMVLALYINDDRTSKLYAHPEIIWFACPLLLTWITRVWMLAHRGLMHDDPVIFAVRDKVSLLIGAMMLAVFGMAR